MKEENKNEDKIEESIKEDIMDSEKENEKVERKSKLSFKFSIRLHWKYIYYIVIIILCVILRGMQSEISVTLGDFGTIIPVLLNVFALNGLKWCPILGIIGIVVTLFEKKYPEISRVYLVATGFITIVSILLQLIV